MSLESRENEFENVKRSVSHSNYTPNIIRQRIMQQKVSGKYGELAAFIPESADEQELSIHRYLDLEGIFQTDAKEALLVQA